MLTRYKINAGLLAAIVSFSGPAVAADQVFTGCVLSAAGHDRNAKGIYQTDLANLIARKRPELKKLSKNKRAIATHLCLFAHGQIPLFAKT